MERVALYCRVSTEEQAKHGLSLAEQEHSLEEYAKENKLKVVDKYIDAGISGRKRYTKRPEMLRLLEDVKANKIDTVLFIRLDRWFRSVGDYYEVQRILDDHHVSWRATQDDYETVTASGRFKVNIMLSVAQDEADRTSERIKFVFEGKRERGEAITGRIPFGYKIENKKIVLDDKTAPLARRIFEIYMDTGSIKKIIDGISEVHLTRGRIEKILKNQSYVGKFSGIDIPPIITMEEWERIVSVRKNHSRATKSGNVYIFSGLIFCKECGGRMGGRPYHKHDSKGNITKSGIYYACYKYENSGGCQNRKVANQSKVEQYLLEHIDSKIENVAIEAKQKQETESNKPKRDAITRKLSKLSELYVNDLIEMKDYKKQYQALRDELAAIPGDLPQADIDKLQQTFFGNWKEIYMDLRQEEKQAFWRSTLKSITVYDGMVTDFYF